MTLITRLNSITTTTLKYLSLVLGALVALTPVWVILLISFKTGQELADFGALALPQNWLNISNYTTAFTRGNMLLGFTNTSIILAVSLAGTIFIGSMTAYVLSRFNFRLKRPIIFLFLLASLVPGVTTQVATFQVVNALGLFNTLWSAIVLYLGTDIIAIYIFLQFLESIPTELDEAAILEGASYFTVYWRIILPLLQPAIITVIILRGVAIYNDFFTPFIYMPKTELGVISTVLFRFRGPYITQWEVIGAGIILTMLPTLIIFIALQKYIYNGLTRGATR